MSKFINDALKKLFLMNSVILMTLMMKRQITNKCSWEHCYTCEL